jgi:glycosidase
METTLSGTIFVYQGEELGMVNVPRSWGPEEYKDVETQNYWKKMTALHPGDAALRDHARDVMQRKARDHARTPMQWSADPNAGFCPAGVAPWMRVHDNYPTLNARAQQLHPPGPRLSVLQFWQRALARRKEHRDVFVYGDFESLDDEDDTVFAYRRWSADEAFVVVLNFSGQSVEWVVPGRAKVRAWVVGNYSAGDPGQSPTGTIRLRPWEALLGTAAL